MDPRFTIAPSISPEAAAILGMIGQAIALMPDREPPQTLADFEAARERGEAFAAQISAGPIQALAPQLEDWRANGTPVLTVRPTTLQSGLAPLVYIHGGGFVSGSARANLLTAAMAAHTSGRIVHSIDYTLAPRAGWREIQAEVIDAWRIICERSTSAPGLIGDSAGGCIAAAVSLSLRDQGLPNPGALVLFSPVTDLSGQGDTNQTLAPYDYLDARALAPGIRAYAGPEDWDLPLVSPLRGDFAKGFPPTLLQVGTREMLLSDSVRLHRALHASGRVSRLEVYEGMPHVFQPLLSLTPEGRQAWSEVADFWNEHLR